MIATVLLAYVVALQGFQLHDYEKNQKALLDYLANTSSMLLLSIDPNTDGCYHTFSIISESSITDSKEIVSAVESLSKSTDIDSKLLAKCFVPRHGIKLLLKDKTVVDLVICLECHALVAYANGKSIKIVLSKDSKELVEKLFPKPKK